MTDKTQVTIMLPTALVEKTKAIAFSKSTMNRRLTYADVIREALRTAIAATPETVPPTKSNQGGLHDCDED